MYCIFHCQALVAFLLGTIGHLKSDHRLGHNLYKGLVGDAVNLLLWVVAAYNFKRSMRALCYLLKHNKRKAKREVIDECPLS